MSDPRRRRYSIHTSKTRSHKDGGGGDSHDRRYRNRDDDASRPNRGYKLSPHNDRDETSKDRSRDRERGSFKAIKYQYHRRHDSPTPPKREPKRKAKTAGGIQRNSPLDQPSPPLIQSGPRSYSQKSDNTLSPFLTANREYIGQDAMIKEEAGTTPTSDEVRVGSLKNTMTTMGQGLHEAVPTNMASEISKIPNRDQRSDLAQIQSGLRTTPALTPMRDPRTKGKTAGHTGTFVSPSRPKASQKTGGQGPAHDFMRKSVRSAIASGYRGAKLLSDIANAHIENTPTGEELLRDKYIHGATPNLRTYGRLESPDHRSLSQAHTIAREKPERFGFSSKIHDIREKNKDRLRAFNENMRQWGEKSLRDPSPQREPLQLGGGYKRQNDRPHSPVPEFGSNDRNIANASAWLTQHQRIKPGTNK